MTISEQQIQSVLQQTIDPTTNKDYVTAKSVGAIQITGNNVTIEIALGYPANSVKNQVQ